jgi:hypothetical protein
MFQRREVEALEFLRVVEVPAHWIGLGRMLVQQFDFQVVRPPVVVCGTAAGGVLERTFGFS